MKKYLKTLLLKSRFTITFLVAPSYAHAQNKLGQNSGGDLLQITLGLLIVLSLIIALAWIVKKVTTLQSGGQTVARIVGAVSVGTRERVVVLEIANRLIVVGVASGHVSAIANLDIDTADLKYSKLDTIKSGESFFNTLMAQLKNNYQSNRNKDA